MPSFRTTRRVPYAAADMFDLVADVERYPEFLPMCTGMTVRRRSTDETGREVLVATMSVGYKAIRESFTSRVTLDRAALTVLVEYIDGPFSRLENRWTFVDDAPPAAAGQGQPGAEASAPKPAARSRVEFFIDYEFRSRMLGLLMGGVFDAAFRRFAEAFEQRAGVVYGRRRAREAGA